MKINLSTSPMAAVGILTAKPTLHGLLECISAEWGITPDDLRKRTQKHEVLIPRQLAIFVMFNYFAMSTTRIGAHFGKDHSTVCYTAALIRDTMQVDYYFRRRAIRCMVTAGIDHNDINALIDSPNRFRAGQKEKIANGDINF
jgi:hypothetical protein